MTALTRRRALAFTGAGLASTCFPAKARTAAIWTKQAELAVGGGAIHYGERGAGAPLVLLPKLGGWIADWEAVAPLIASGRRLIAIDPPGHGGSRMNGPAPHIMTMPECAAMVLAALDTIGIERCDFLGNSLGGVISLLIAATYPERVDRLALISTAMAEPMTRAQILRQDAERRAAGTPLVRSAAEQKARFGTIDPAISRQQAQSNAQAGAWKAACERGVGLLGIARYLPRVAAETLVISADRGAYLRYNAVARAAMPHVRIETVTDTGSFVHQEKPQAAAALLNDFLTR